MRPLGILTAIAAATTLPAVAAAQPAAPLDPARVANIDRWVTDLVARQRIPGASALIVKDGRVVYEKAWGVRDIDTKAPLKHDDLFRIASQTKAITSVAVMMLWEEGRFGLDEPVGNYLPAFKEHTVLNTFNPADSSYEAKPTRRRITIRQLLTHTSGLDYADIGSDEFKAIYAKAGITACASPTRSRSMSSDASSKCSLAARSSSSSPSGSLRRSRCPTRTSACRRPRPRASSRCIRTPPARCAPCASRAAGPIPTTRCAR